MRALAGKLLLVVLPISVVGGACYGLATWEFVSRPADATTIVGVAAFLLASTLAERFPVPVEGTDANGVSLGFVFAVAALVLFGWAPATFVYATAPTIVALIDHRPLVRTVFNAGVFGFVGMLAGVVLGPVHGTSAGALLLEVALTALVLYAANIPIVTAAISASGSERRYRDLMRANVSGTLLPFALMASTALMLVVLWQRTPYLFAALAGPLAAISLYQRSTHNALKAMRLALTDPLTGLGNHRHFHERLQRELDGVESNGGLVSLCLLDVDGFKRINDRFGHPAGDRVLAQIAARLRSGGEAFRLGGDEFAVLLPGADANSAAAAAESILERIEAVDFGEVTSVTMSVGVATFPQHGGERDALIRLADGALYWAKEHGKNRVQIARPDLVELTAFRQAARDSDLAARLSAAAALALAVDSHDAYMYGHSARVATLSAAIAEHLGLATDQVDLVRLAGSLHDLGKLGIPEEILCKQEELSDGEREIVRRHPQIGYRMLESLGVEPVAGWVLHHHERWDGSGYPHGLAGDEIPLGARILFAADAYDAMTSERPYGDPLTPEQAADELERCTGGHFDPEVVAALLAVVGAGDAVTA